MKNAKSLFAKMSCDQNRPSTLFLEVAHGVVLYPQLDCLDDSTERGSNNILKVDLE